MAHGCTLRGWLLTVATVGSLIAAAGCGGTVSPCDCRQAWDTRDVTLPSGLPANATMVQTDWPCAASIIATNLVYLTVNPGSTVRSCGLLVTLDNGDQYAATATFHEATYGCCGDEVTIDDVSSFLPRG